MARSPRNYPYDLRTGDLKGSAYDSLLGLAIEMSVENTPGYLKTPEGKEEYFDQARELYPDISDADLWDVWRDWYHGTG